MKRRPSSARLLACSLAVLVGGWTAVIPSASLRAQVVEDRPVQAIPPNQGTTIPAVAEHVAEIELAVVRGSVQAYFGRAAARERVEVGNVEINIKLPSSATVTKLASRDKDSAGSHRVTPDNPWIVRVPFSGPGRYVFNIQEWDDDPVVAACSVRVDGVTLFSGRGSEEDLDGWAQKTFSPEVKKTGKREIAFVLP